MDELVQLVGYGKVDTELEGMLARAFELLKDLEEEYNVGLRAHIVTEPAKNLTHETLEKLRNALDHVMMRAWQKYVSPSLSDRDRRRARVYFPITSDLKSLRSTLGRSGMADLDQVNKNLYDFLLKKQPFSSQENGWLFTLREVTNKGKHVRLVPQKRMETRRIRVTGPDGGSMSWDANSVRFGPGVRIMGAPVDPRTQRIVRTPGRSEQVEVWVSFILEGYGVNALGFCKESYEKTRALIEEMVDLFGI